MKLFVCTLVLSLLVLSSVSAETYFYADHSAIAKKGDDTIYLYQSLLKTDSQTLTLPFGQVVHASDRFGFTSKELDSSSLQYFGARYYDASTGRFTSSDPKPDDAHVYAYTRNNPLFFTDPDGQATLKQYQYYIKNDFAPLVKENYEHYLEHGSYPEGNFLARLMPADSNVDCADMAMCAYYQFKRVAGESARFYANNKHQKGSFSYVRAMVGAINLLENKNTFEVDLERADVGDLIVVRHSDGDGGRSYHTAMFAEKPYTDDKGVTHYTLMYDTGSSPELAEPMKYVKFDDKERGFFEKVHDYFFERGQAQEDGYYHFFFESSDEVQVRRWREFRNG